MPRAHRRAQWLASSDFCVSRVFGHALLVFCWPSRQATPKCLLFLFATYVRTPLLTFLARALCARLANDGRRRMTRAAPSNVMQTVRATSHQRRAVCRVESLRQRWRHSRLAIVVHVPRVPRSDSQEFTTRGNLPAPISEYLFACRTWSALSIGACRARSASIE